MKDVTRREAMKSVIGAGTLVVFGQPCYGLAEPLDQVIDGKKTVKVSIYNRYRPFVRAMCHLYDAGFTQLDIKNLTKFIQPLVRDMDGSICLEPDVKDRLGDIVKGYQRRFNEATQNIVWVHEDGKEMPSSSMWFGICLTLGRKNMDCIAFLNGEGFDQVFPEPEVL